MVSTESTFQHARDQRVQNDVMQQIAWQPDVDAKDVSVKVNDGNVALTGFVHTYFEKSSAERAAKSVIGVLSVANDLEVRPKGRRSDPEIARDVVEALRLHSSVPDDRLKVTVRDGFVTLEGKVTWEFQRRSAERVTQEVLGVRGIVNSIDIAPVISTTEVRTKIEDAWKRMVNLDARLMSVVANNGKVSLYGTVHSLNEREQAELAAWQAPGVHDVENNLVVAA